MLKEEYYDTPSKKVYDPIVFCIMPWIIHFGIAVCGPNYVAM
jgi:hypothetical protein